MPSPRDFRRSRRALALVFRDGPKTASEASRALGKPTGAIYGALTRMVAEGLLIADTPEPGRGTRYRLAPEADAVLREMERDEAVVGALAKDQQMVLVDRPTGMQQGGVQRILAAGWIAEAASWAAEIDGGWLVAFADSYQARRLQMELGALGLESRSLSVSAVMTGQALATSASWLLEDVKDRAES